MRSIAGVTSTGRRGVLGLALATLMGMASALPSGAEQPPSPCHANPNADADAAAVSTRGDVANLPDPLKNRLAQLASRPHTFPPIPALLPKPYRFLMTGAISFR